MKSAVLPEIVVRNRIAALHNSKTAFRLYTVLPIGHSLSQVYLFNPIGVSGNSTFNANPFPG